VVCPLAYAELAPAFRGKVALQDEFLHGVGVDLPSRHPLFIQSHP